MTGAVDSAAPREQPTTQNQCSCRFKWTKIGEWEAGNEEEVEKKVRDKSKNGREKRGGGTLGAWGRKKNEGWELNQLQVREGRTSRNKKGDPSISSHLKGKKGWRWVHQFASEGLGKRKGERLFFFLFHSPSVWLGGARSLNQACKGGGDPRCLPHPSRSAGPGASTGRGCTTWKLWPWF